MRHSFRSTPCHPKHGVPRPFVVETGGNRLRLTFSHAAGKTLDKVLTNRERPTMGGFEFGGAIVQVVYRPEGDPVTLTAGALTSGGRGDGPGRLFLFV